MASAKRSLHADDGPINRTAGGRTGGRSVGRGTPDTLASRGGSFHGPNVEHGTMAEPSLLPFLRALATSQNELVPVIAAALGRAHPTIKPTTEDEFEIGATVDAHQSVCEEVAEALGGLSPGSRSPAESRSTVREGQQ